MRLSVIIPCLNGAKTIAGQLEALAKQQWSEEWEVIVSDNGSTDGSQSVVEQYKDKVPNLRVVDASHQRGAAHALNAGASAAMGDALAFCDVDDEVATGWLAAMGDALKTHDFVGCRIEVDKLNEPWVRKTHGALQQHQIPVFNYPPYLPHVGAGTIGIKRALHQTVGGFDESMPVHFETDYCFKIQRKGIKLEFVPDAVLHVRYRPTLSGLWRQAFLWGKYHVFVYKRYRKFGMEPLSWKEGILRWKELLMDARRLRSKGDFASWLWRFGWRLGRVQGCIKFRVLAI